jgi:hypothetical protein
MRCPMSIWAFVMVHAGGKFAVAISRFDSGAFGVNAKSTI